MKRTANYLIFIKKKKKKVELEHGGVPKYQTH